MSGTEPFRRSSAVISSCPWQVDDIVLSSDFRSSLSADHPNREFLSVLTRIERDISTRQNADNIHAFRKTIRLGEDQVPRRKITSAPIVRPLYPPFKFYFIRTVLIYRLLEVMIILEDVPRTHFVPKFNRRKALGCGPSLGWGKMKDWTEALMNFREEMSTLGGEGNSGHSAANIDVTLLRSISSKLKHGKALVSVTNIEAAGLLLRAIWKGYWSDASNKENVIDFLTKADHKPLESLGDLDIDAIRQPIKDFHRLNLPIHVAGFLSPLGLITGVPLCSRDYDRYSIFLMWRALGNMQPILLRCVEKLLWHAIISVAQGQETGHSALVTFLAQVPWEKLGSVQDSERRWFHAVEKKGNEISGRIRRYRYQRTSFILAVEDNGGWTPQ